LLFIIALVDVIVGFLLVFNWVFALHTLLFYFGWIILVKGAWTLFDTMRKKFYFDVPGWIDVLSGIAMLVIFLDGSFPLFWFFKAGAMILGVVILLKGLWSILSAM